MTLLRPIFVDLFVVKQTRTFATISSEQVLEYKGQLEGLKPRPRGFWKNKDNQKEFFDRLQTQLGYKSMEDWYKVTLEDMYSFGALMGVYPEHNWQLDRFKNKPRGFLKDKDNHKKFFEQLRIQVGYKSMDDWYDISNEIVLKGGALMSVYPEHNWQLDKFKHKPKGFWKDNRNHKKFFDWLYVQLGYKSKEDWYKLTAEDVVKNGGTLRYHNYSPSSALMSVYPEHNWELERFKYKPQRFWKEKENQKKVFDSLFTRLGYRSMEDWYKVTLEDFKKNGLAGLLYKYYHDSPTGALLSVYPEHNWMLWRFKSVPNGYVSGLSRDTKEVARLIDWLGKQLSVKHLEEWYRVSVSQIRKVVQIESANSLAEMLQKVYPEHKWDKKVFGRLGPNRRTSQGALFRVVQKLFPTQKVEEDYRHPELAHSSGHKMEFDVYIEALKLAFEYQGEHHYKPLFWTSVDFAQQQSRDREKRKACKQHTITLIEVPYWWDKTTESLASTIHIERSELVPNPPSCDPIPTTARSIMTSTSPPLSHGYSWDGVQDVTGWWMSEKIDGIRGYWDGQQMLSRHGNAISCPNLCASLPKEVTLDGELWMGEGTTHDDITKLHSDDRRWSQIGYYIFDIPSSTGTYEQRMEEMLALKPFLPPRIRVVENVQCSGQEHLYEYLDSIVATEGEGVMLRKPGTKYDIGLTASLLKVKKYEDTEVKVLAAVEGGISCQQ